MIDINNFNPGLHILEDSTKAPIGSAREMVNVLISDRGGISKRPGTKLLGAVDTSTTGLTGLYNYTKSFATVELPMKASNGTLKYYHPDTLAWETLKTGYTAASEFGFKEHLVNTQNQDYVYFCNRTEDYSRWSGETTQVNGALSGGETTITVDTTLQDDIFNSQTAIADNSATFTADAGTDMLTSAAHGLVDNDIVTFTTSASDLPAPLNVGQIYYVIRDTDNTFQVSITYGGSALGITDAGTGTHTFNHGSSTTTLSIDTNAWAASQWVNFYVYITSGGEDGSIRKITASTPNAIIFDELDTDPGAATFEIRLPKFPETGTIVVGGTEVAYTAIPTATTFTVASAPATSDNAAVTLATTEYPANPKGNVLETHFTRMIVGNVRSAISRDEAGNLQGNQSTGSYYVSKIKQADDFQFQATRVAGEGDIVSTPYGGGHITDIANQEDSFYVFKENYIESAKYTQDSNDIVARVPLKAGIGAQGRVIKGANDVYFVTPNNEISSIGRAATKDLIPQATNIGSPIKRLLDTYDFSKHRGGEYKNRIFFACKEDPTDTANNRVIIYNSDKKAFEGIWYLNAFGFMSYGDKPYYGSSTTQNVYEMFEGTDDIEGDNTFGITSVWKSNWMNLTPKSKFDLQSIQGFGAEGYLRGNTKIGFQVFKDFSSDATVSFTFTGNEEGYIDKDNFGDFMGLNPLGITYEGKIDDPDESGFRHFQFIVYFPPMYGTYFSLGVSNSGKNQSYDVTRLSVDVLADPLLETTRVKTI